MLRARAVTGHPVAGHLVELIAKNGVNDCTNHVFIHQRIPACSKLVVIRNAVVVVVSIAGIALAVTVGIRLVILPATFGHGFRLQTWPRMPLG